MTTTIYKYKLDPTACDKEDLVQIKMPINSVIVSAQEQDSSICLWAIVDSDECAEEDVIFAIRGTGNPFKGWITGEFIDTVQVGGLVWHVFLQKGWSVRVR